MSCVILNRGKERRLIAGHAWVYRGEIERITAEPKDGDVVDIRDHKERHLGRGLLNRKSLITVRRFTTGKEEIDRQFFRDRIRSALAYRKQVLPAATAFRVVFSESDQLPGLIVDQFGDHAVVQALTLGIDQRKQWIAELLQELLHVRVVIERSDVPTRRLEGLEESKGVLAGESDGKVQLAMDGLKYRLDLLGDQKTGYFLDQSENYRIVSRHAKGGRVLDCFSYHGGFALHAAREGAKSVEAVEISETSVARAKENAALNGLGELIQFRCANAFDVLKQYDSEKRQFDLIVLDPPTFTRSKDRVAEAVRGYKEINLRALKMLPPGGVLATFSCSQHIHSEMFKEVVIDAAADARKPVRLRRALTQSPDHPVLLGMEQTEYLKGLLVQVIG